MDPLVERRNEERERRRAEIIDAAHRVAREVGYDALTMDQVARAARLSRGLLYVYFQDRVDLHLALCERALGIFQAAAATAVAREQTGLDRLLAIGRSYVEFAAAEPVYFEAMARFEASPGSLSEAEGNMPACLAASARIFDLIVGFIDEGVRDGSVSPTLGAPRSIAIALWALMHGAVQIARMKPGVLESQGVAPAELTDQVMRIAAVALADTGPAEQPP